MSEIADWWVPVVSAVSAIAGAAVPQFFASRADKRRLEAEITQKDSDYQRLQAHKMEERLESKKEETTAAALAFLTTANKFKNDMRDPLDVMPVPEEMQVALGAMLETCG